MTLKNLLAILLVYRSNFHLLHWNVKGPRFDTAHKIASDYYDKILDDADIVAEMSIRMGSGVVNYPEAYEILNSIEDHNFTIVDSDKTYKFDDLCKISSIMFKDILFAIEQVLTNEEIQAPSNVGIKATLESMHNEYDLQYRYINARRIEEE